ncbi:MAG TPA: serine/threonine-protein kinase [Phycisphaerales bacterium]|nr:serine/threonine-protein kinase [Phycisphaerales bacterium]
MTIDARKPGEMIEGFRVLAEVGRGAASIIYLVQDPKTKQIWALKHVEKETDKDQRFLDQAEEEYKIASRIKSPTIRKIERLIRKREGLLSTSELYLVMEHVDGSSLEREPPVTFADAVYICEQVAQGLAEMHKEGYVHADMKPNNVIVTSNLTAKIIDLGQSCKIGTVKQRIQGTPDYIAPEQVHRRAITPKTDVYNLGATMYWIFTRSFVPTALTGKSDSLVQGLEEAFIPKPKKVSEFNPRVPEMLEALVMQCVETNPDDRPTMEQVAERLNLIRGKLSAESIMRRTATPTTDEARA